MRRQKAYSHEVLGVYPPVRDMESAGSADRVTKGDCPSVLEQDDGGAGVARYVIYDVPDLVFVKYVDAVFCRGGASFGAGDGAFEPRRPKADQGPDDRAELRRFLVVKVGSFDRGDRTLRVLVNGNRVDYSNDVVFLEPVELSEDLSLEFGLVESEYQQLDGSDNHIETSFPSFFSRTVAHLSAAANTTQYRESEAISAWLGLGILLMNSR